MVKKSSLEGCSQEFCDLSWEVQIKTSESFEQVMKISLKCMAEQLAFDDADCAEMIKNQREANVKLRQKAEELEEENRNLKNELNDLKYKYGKGE